MYWIHVTSLVLIALLWLILWLAGLRGVTTCGVTDRMTRWSLATVPATAGLVLSVHLPAFLTLFSSRGWVSPEAVAVVYLLIAAIGVALVRRMLRTGEESRRDGPGSSHSCRNERPSLPREGRGTLDARRSPSRKHSSVRGEEQNAARSLSGPSSSGGRLSTGGPVATLVPVPSFVPILPIMLIGATYAVFFVDAVTRFPTGYDGLHYHLPQAIHWMQTGSLDMMVGQMHRSLPDNAMLIPTLLSFAGLEKLITLFNVPNGLLLGACVWGLCRAVRLGPAASCVAACVALSVPVVVFQTFSSYVDLYATVAWMLSLLALVWASRTRTRRNHLALIVLGGLSGGVALGCKTTYLVLVFFLVMLACLLAWVAGDAQVGRLRRSLWGGLIFGAAALACSAFWFVRGAVQAGNPVYPLAVSAGDQQILPGFTDDDWFPRRPLATTVQRWWHYPWTEPKYAGSGEIYSVNNGLGAAYATFVPIGVLFALGTVWKLRRRRHLEDRWMAIYTLIVLAGVVLLLTVFEEVLRYVLGPVLLAIPVSAWLYQRLQIRFPRSVSTALNVALAVTVLVAVLQPARALAGRIRDGSWSRRAFYQIPDVINLLPAGARVLNLGPPQYTYPLYGARFENDVIPGTLWNTMTNGGDVSAETLQSHAIDYIFLRQPPPGQPWPDSRWVMGLPVEVIYDDSPYFMDRPTPASRIYRVRREILSPSGRDNLALRN